MNAVAREFAPKAYRIQWPLIWSVLIAALLTWGAQARLERYITPQRGVGYWLGIAGGSMMVLLLMYSARKRAPWLHWMGGIPAWFEFHMVLGIAGPVLILFHANFHLGATNSNVALFCMLLVAGSGVVGRYIYTRLHASVDGSEYSIARLKAGGDRFRLTMAAIAPPSDLVEAIERIESRLLVLPDGILYRSMHVLSAPLRVAAGRRMLSREIDQAFAQALPRHSSPNAARLQRISALAGRYSARRLDAARRAAEHRTYADIFSFWHILHMPLFFMLLIAGIVHVIAVNIY